MVLLLGSLEESGMLEVQTVLLKQRALRLTQRHHIIMLMVVMGVVVMMMVVMVAVTLVVLHMLHASIIHQYYNGKKCF